MLDLMQALHGTDARAPELSGLLLSDEELGELGLEQLEQLEQDAGAAVLAIMLPGSLSEEEQESSPADAEHDELDSLWSAALGEPPSSSAAAPSPHERDPAQDEAMAQLDDDLVSGELSESGPDEVMTMMMEHSPEASTHADALFPSSAVTPLPPLGLRGALVPPPGPEKKRRGRKPSASTKEKKPSRPPPSEAKARLRSYERRSRHKREVSGQFDWPAAYRCL
ncbi:hypothetical protein PHYPSEUDO_012317 [Phytophthora pseudosyringae]|uniref:Uncharacterized protein n=1 Tax=Phytophthora pseudosyringae TaxID=221518 RepID=A0A8T1W5E1_9STRA|nr:hypothetical protein PHYPSEUDO_012317 [Phytophthora pseudosyringae]